MRIHPTIFVQQCVPVTPATRRDPFQDSTRGKRRLPEKVRREASSRGTTGPPKATTACPPCFGKILRQMCHDRDGRHPNSSEEGRGDSMKLLYFTSPDEFAFLIPHWSWEDARRVRNILLGHIPPVISCIGEFRCLFIGLYFGRCNWPGVTKPPTLMLHLTYYSWAPPRIP